MKKIIAVLLCACVALMCLAGCGGAAGSSAQPAASAAEESSSPKAPAESITLKIGTCAPESSTFVGNSQIFADKLAELSLSLIHIYCPGACGPPGPDAWHAGA